MVYHLQKTKQLIPTYLQKSNHILNDLNILYPLPPGTNIFTTDVVAMYPNINTDEGLATVRENLNPREKKHQQTYQQMPSSPVGFRRKGINRKTIRGVLHKHCNGTP